MNQPESKGKFAVSNGPVNRRTAAPAQRAAKPNTAPVVVSRLRAAQAKHRLGAPLAQRLAGGSTSGSAGRPIRASVIAQSIGCTVSGVGVFVAGIQGAWPAAGLGAAAFLALGAWAWRGYRAQRTPANHDAERVVMVVDAADLERLDGLLEQVGKLSAPATVDLLVAFKETLIRCVTLASEAQTSSALLSEDTLFIGQTVRRYVPDSLQAFLKVPAAERDTCAMDDGKTATILLREQLQLIEQKIKQCEARLNLQSGEALLQQQRFLAAKTQATSM